jgi:hypothetical protein
MKAKCIYRLKKRLSLPAAVRNGEQQAAAGVEGGKGEEREAGREVARKEGRKGTSCNDGRRRHSRNQGKGHYYRLKRR